MFEHSVAHRMSLLHTESAFGIMAHANALEAQGKRIIHMEIGQPDFKTPRNIIEAAYRAMNSGYTGYTPTPGLPVLRNAIADYARRWKQIDTSPEEIVVVPGGKPVMFYTMLMLIEPGDEVIYPNPSFPIYESCIKFAGGVPVPLPLTAENGFRLDVNRLRALITPKTKLVLINSPSNPTGGVFTPEDIQSLADALRPHPDIFILSDEIYDRLVFGKKPPSIASLPGMKDRTIILDGFSKTYSMTGWRLGYGILHPDLAKHMEMLMVNSNSCAAAFTQMAAVEALTGPQNSVETMKRAFRERRDYLVAALNGIPGITCCMPQGAFYAFPDISSFGLDCKTFCDRLLEEAGVAAAWGTSFGAYGEGYLRLSYATSLENIREAVRRIGDFTARL
ncbi:MAG: pyridoxal phosphate-dependent aminotransferase [Intestinimonas sp.]|jgi:aspartate/methionine/tyrosine aminotransferase|nr:pyridoxal phosphate-dependent aminotransferase [Intestinimonas sp.]